MRALSQLLVVKWKKKKKKRTTMKKKVGINDQPAPCADTLQDLLRTVRKLLSVDNNNGGTRLALLDEAPWKALTVDNPSAALAMVGGMDVPWTSNRRRKSYQCHTRVNHHYYLF